MTRRGWGLVAGAAVTLLLSAWVAAAGPVSIFVSQDFSGAGTRAPGEVYGATQVDNTHDLGRKVRDAPRGDSPLAVFFTWAIKAVVVAVVVVLLVVLVRVALERLAARRVAARPEEVTGELAPDVLLAAARESTEVLARGTPANAVVAAWVRLEDAVRAAGIDEDRTRTSAELVTRVLRSYQVDRGALDRLSALYREARFSEHEIGEGLREQAREALAQVQADLARALPPRAERPARALRGSG